MKKVFKSRIFAFVLGAIIFSGITAVSAYTIFANDIGYTPKDSTWKKSNGEDITNVKDAIDELYSKAINKPISIIDSNNRNTYNIPNGVTKAYVLYSHSTSFQNLNLEITGDILLSTNQIYKNTNVDNYGDGLRNTLDIIELNLVGDSGTISLSVTGGGGALRAWSSGIVY